MPLLDTDVEHFLLIVRGTPYDLEKIIWSYAPSQHHNAKKPMYDIKLTPFKRCCDSDGLEYAQYSIEAIRPYAYAEECSDDEACHEWRTVGQCFCKFRKGQSGYLGNVLDADEREMCDEE
jgi:hypothetical protein